MPSGNLLEGLPGERSSCGGTHLACEPDFPDGLALSLVVVPRRKVVEAPDSRAKIGGEPKGKKFAHLVIPRCIRCCSGRYYTERMPAYLVTGCAGFIGSAIAQALVARGESVRGLDNFETGKPANMAKFRDRIEFVECDLRDADAVLNACKDVDFVFHTGALPSVPRSVKDPRTSHTANIDGTFNLLEGARAAGVKSGSCIRLLHRRMGTSRVFRAARRWLLCRLRLIRCKS